MARREQEYEENVDPNLIRFTHSRIKPVFSDGRLVVSTLEDIISKKLKVEDLPKIVVYKQDETTYYSMNNRRLWVFKECRKLNLIKNVPVRIRYMPTNKRQKNKFSTERCVLNAKFFKEKKLNHEMEEGSNDESD